MEKAHTFQFLYFNSGPNDQILSWPLIGTAKVVELLNQLTDKNHYDLVYTFTENCNTRAGNGFTSAKFIRHSELTHSADRQFLMDDTLYFRVTQYQCATLGNHGSSVQMSL